MTMYITVKINKVTFANGESADVNAKFIPLIDWNRPYPATVAKHGACWAFDVWIDAEQTIPCNIEEVIVDAECLHHWKLDQHNFSELVRIDAEIADLQDERSDVELRLWQRIG